MVCACFNLWESDATTEVAGMRRVNRGEHDGAWFNLTSGSVSRRWGSGLTFDLSNSCNQDKTAVNTVLREAPV